ncbi:ATP-dependent DNA helicase II subunit 1 [Malassezia pachydermatis]
MLTKSKSGFWPNTVEYTAIKQVDVPTTFQLRELLRRIESDPSVLEERMKPCSTQISVEHVLSNAMHLLSTSAKASTRRVFFITNQDDPHPGKNKRIIQKACVDRVKVRSFVSTHMQDYYRRGIDLEPFFMSSATEAFHINTFYAEILGVYDDGLLDDTLRPWRLRQMQDQNVSKRAVWDSTMKLAELDEQLSGREMPKRVVFDLTMDLGPLSKPAPSSEEEHSHFKTPGSSQWRIHVKGYSLISEATPDLPVKVSSFGREDPNDLYEVTNITQWRRADTGDVVQPSDMEQVYDVSKDNSPRSHVAFTNDEIKSLRQFGCIPSLRLLGFKDRSTLHFYENLKHSYFLYPSDLEQPGSKRVFAALLQSMLSKNKVALTLFMSRDNVIPTFAILLPQAEELDEEGHQLVPPGLNLIVMPYMDDIREPPEARTLTASKDEITMASRLIDTFHRKDPFNPDVFSNPALTYHYGLLMAEAFGTPAPFFEDTTLPQYDLIEHVCIHRLLTSQRAHDAIQAWNDAIEADPRTQGSSSDMNSAKTASIPEAVLRQMHKDGTLHQVCTLHNSHAASTP